MNRNILSLVSILALSGVSFGGGDITPVEEPVVVIPEAAVADEGGFYLGAGFGGMRLNNDLTDEEFSATGMMLQAGYRYNRYIALEGRYTFNIGDVDYTHGNSNNPDYPNYPTDFTNAAVYLKPVYPVDSFALYALLGYGEVALTNIPQGDVDRAEDGFQWGVGAGYAFNDNILAFVDYVQMYSGKGFDYRAIDADMTADAWTLGVSYEF